MKFWLIRPRYIVLALLCGAVIYAALWYVEANRARGLIGKYIGDLQAHGYGIATGDIAVGGFPLAIRVSMPDVKIDGFPRLAAAQLSTPRLDARCWPWDPVDWTISAPQGMTVAFPVGGQRGRLAIGAINADVDVATDGGYQIDVHANDTAYSVADAPGEKVAKLALDLSVPAKQVNDPDVKVLDFALQLDGLTLAAPVGPLGSTIDSATIAGSINGIVPQKPLAAALAEWRDSGGTIEIRQAALNWAKLSMSGEGTISLDHDMQPEAAFSATLRGWSTALDALAASGAIKSDQATFLRMGLTLFSHPGDNGESELKAPVTIQNSELYVEKARLAKIPHLTLPAS